VKSGRAGSAERPLRDDLVDAAVLEAYGLAQDQGWLADRALERVLRRERALWASERRAVAEAVYGLIRWRAQLEWLLGGEGARASVPLRYALWLARFGGFEPERAARRLGVAQRALGPLEGADQRIGAVADPVERLAVEESLPRWIAALFAAEMGLDEARLLARAMNQRAPLTVRANLLKATRDELRARLAEEGVGAEPTPHSPWGLVLDGHENAFALRSFREGWFEIQDEGSQLLAFCCTARPGQKVVDACAGAGGKSLALAMEMHGKGSLFALDVDEGRLDEARRRARRAGVHNLRARIIPASGAAAEEAVADLDGQAERVFIDAPCSGLGTLRRKPDARWRLRPEDPERFAGIQRDLVLRFSRLVKPGGRLVYATCAVGRRENEEVADFLAAEARGLVPFPVAAALGEERARALGADGHLLRLLPHRHGTDGFFAALFERR
jgi:16S rRNA (cytosine967-C5)-methyltransferase